MFDEIVAKALVMTRAKVINIVVNYSSKMEMLLAEMRKLMVGFHLAVLQPGALDLSKFPEILAQKSFMACLLLQRLPKRQYDPPAFQSVQARMLVQDQRMGNH